MQERPLARLDRPRDAELVEQGIEQRLGREEIRLTRRTAPGARRERAAEQRAQLVALVDRLAGLRPGEHGARLEDRDVGSVVEQVVTRSIEQRAEQRGPHERLRIRERVAQAHRAAQLVSGRQQQPVEQLRAGEAPAGYLVQPAAGQRLLGRSARPLSVRELARRPAPCRQRGGDVLEAVQARDLLD